MDCIFWSRDRINWFEIGNEFSFLRSDYGRWGAEKRMIRPALVRGKEGNWHCIWTLNEKDAVFAHASSTDLIDWGRQSYPAIQRGLNFLDPEIAYQAAAGIYWIGYSDSSGKRFRLSTPDFKTYSTPVEVASTPSSSNVRIRLTQGEAIGQVHEVPWKLVERLMNSYEVQSFRSALYSESAKEDPQRFAGLKPLSVSLSLSPGKAKPISPELFGIFFEDINYAADGGIYAELIQNRDFEYHPADKSFRDKAWTASHSWSIKGAGTDFRIDSTLPLHPNNPHYILLKTTTAGAALVNTGFDGIPLKMKEAYHLSFFASRIAGGPAMLEAKLVDRQGKMLARRKVSLGNRKNWTKFSVTLVPSESVADALLEISIRSKGELALDMISLFPEKTFRGHKNGLRADLAQTIADLHPRFVRFPGGCVAHGDGLDNIYRWKNTIGPLEARKPQRNIWNYHQSAGLGYFEYFRFCEDIGATPLPVIAAGVPCQNSSTGGAGQQGGIPMEEMDAYIQDILDLIEWANGDAKSKWGRLRAAAGHPAPFRLKYIGIGNEDLITDVFEERYRLICEAIREKHPEITIIGTVGPFYKGTDYKEGWELAEKMKLPMVDEHYYESPGWFIYNQDFYDRYDRSRSKVYLGEYASRGNTWYNALAEAIYLTGVERNGDIVHMSSYAPLLAREGHTQWNPDLIYFDNTSVKPTVNYEIQQLYGANAGDRYIPVTAQYAFTDEKAIQRLSWSVVNDTTSGDIIVKLVNLLPAPATVQLDLAGMVEEGKQGRQILLQGNPSDKKTERQELLIGFRGNTEIILPAYSFSVIRVAAKPGINNKQ